MTSRAGLRLHKHSAARGSPAGDRSQKHRSRRETHIPCRSPRPRAGVPLARRKMLQRRGRLFRIQTPSRVSTRHGSPRFRAPLNRSTRIAPRMRRICRSQIAAVQAAQPSRGPTRSSAHTPSRDASPPSIAIRTTPGEAGGDACRGSPRRSPFSGSPRSPLGRVPRRAPRRAPKPSEVARGAYRQRRARGAGDSRLVPHRGGWPM